MAPPLDHRKHHRDRDQPQPATMTPKAVTTPVPRQRIGALKKPRSGSTAVGASSSEKETPTVVFASSFSTSYSPYAVVETNKSTMIAASALEGPAPTSSTQQCRQSDEDDGSSSSPDEVLTQDLEYRKACAVIQNVLECGIASVCRLRKIFPPSFFERMDVDGTTVTSFRNDHIRNLCSSSIGKENASTNTIDYGETSVNTASVRHTSLSPLTYDASQKSRVDGENKNVGSSYLHGSSTREKEQQTLAMEALLLLYWMKREGVGTILNEGKLARVVFGICVPSEDSMREKGDNDLPSDGELIESYSFNLSCNKPTNQRNVQQTQVQQACCSLFRNLNGYSAGSSLSQVVPTLTQSSHASHLSSLDLSQKSLIMSMSQSIRATVKKNRGHKIPKTRYLTLRVDFTQPLKNCDLPSALKNEKASIFTNYRNPVVPKIGVNPDPKFRASAAISVFDQGSMDEKFVVTPLGTVAENSFSGISVEMMAFSKEQYDDEKDDDHRSIHSKSSFRGSDQFEIDELILDNSFETMLFTQPDVEATESGLGRIDPQFSPREEKSDVVENERLAQKALNSMNCDDDSKYLQPGAEAFGIPYGLGGNQSYLRCIVIDQRTTTSCTGASDRVQYYVEFQDKRLKSKKQYILSRKIMSSNCMITRINVALDKYQETENPSRMASLIKLVADELHVCHDLVRIVASNRVTHAPKGGKTVSQGKHNRILKKRKSGALGSSGE